MGRLPLITRPARNSAEKWDALLYRKKLDGDTQACYCSSQRPISLFSLVSRTRMRICSFESLSRIVVDSSASTVLIYGKPDESPLRFTAANINIPEKSVL
nr:GDP-fucose protein O-fucosyltransferase 2 [Tanacetum cinerariifolium]